MQGDFAVNINDVMTKQVECLQGNETVHNAALKMREVDTGVLPVTAADGKIQGILTDRDIVTRTIAEGADPSQMSVAEAMSTDPVTCRPDCSVDQALELMRDNQIRRLVITDSENGNVVGIVSLGDIAVRTDEAELVSAATEGVCQPS